MTHIFVLTAAALLPALFALYDIHALVCFSHFRCCLFRSPIRADAAR
jgi:hypothetical protein